MPPSFDLTGRAAIVTGASRGIGEAIATAFAAAGAQVVISSRRQDGLDAAAARIAQAAPAGAAPVLPIAAHNGDKAALAALVARTVEVFGGLDIVVSNAATNPHFGPLLDAQDSMWQKTFEVNVMGAFWLLQQTVPHLRSRGGGKIINIASINGLRPGQMQGVYSATKAALINITQTLALELAADQIQVNAIAPGLIRTQFARALWENERVAADVSARTPAGRLGEPDDIAGIACYLASSASDFTTGQVFIIDGGMSVPLL
jgi:NAD(P)-dependent dehydrogenase (short-subunit alcohol dehydrogenase family)